MANVLRLHRERSIHGYRVKAFMALTNGRGSAPGNLAPLHVLSRPRGMLAAAATIAAKLVGRAAEATEEAALIH